ncbi:unnamed protein product [Peniophora sp. CBMAI 1063]|nr:unnamed protein product [Peniophora sp. CBMAI 1063]
MDSASSAYDDTTFRRRRRTNSRRARTKLRSRVSDIRQEPSHAQTSARPSQDFTSFTSSYPLPNTAPYYDYVPATPYDVRSEPPAVDVPPRVPEEDEEPYEADSERRLERPLRKWEPLEVYYALNPREARPTGTWSDDAFAGSASDLDDPDISKRGRDVSHRYESRRSSLDHSMVRQWVLDIQRRTETPTSEDREPLPTSQDALFPEHNTPNDGVTPDNDANGQVAREDGPDHPHGPLEQAMLHQGQASESDLSSSELGEDVDRRLPVAPDFGTVIKGYSLSSDEDTPEDDGSSLRSQHELDWLFVSPKPAVVDRGCIRRPSDVIISSELPTVLLQGSTRRATSLATGIFASVTYYHELCAAQTDAVLETVQARLRSEWQFAMATLLALTAVDATVFGFSPGGTLFAVNRAASYCLTLSSISTAMGLTQATFLLITHFKADVHKFKKLALGVYSNYAFFAVTSRLPFLSVLVSVTSLSAFLLAVAFMMWPKTAIIFSAVGVLLAGLQYFVKDAKKTSAHKERSRKDRSHREDSKCDVEMKLRE